MALKQLGAINITSASTETTVYTVPNGKQTVVSTVLLNNKTTSSATVRLSHVPSGQSIGGAYYVIYDQVIPVGGSITIQLGISMAAGDLLSAYSTVNSSPYVNVIAWGDESAIS